MVLEKEFEIFDIKNIDDLFILSDKELKKRYHELCLLYHPDKKTDIKKYDFIDVKQSYETLLEYKKMYNNNTYNRTNCNKDNIYNDMWSMMDSLFNINTLNKILEYIDLVSVKSKKNKSDNINSINYNVSYSQVYNKNVFFDDKYQVYIPLWHRVVYLNDLYDMFEMNKLENNVIFNITINDLKENVKILSNNDLIVKINRNELKKNIVEKDNNKYIKIEISDTDTILLNYDDNMLKNSVKIYNSKGIPRICESNIYDTSEISNFIILLI